MSETITRTLVRDAAEILLPDGRRFATQRWITTCDDWREIEGLGLVNFGWVRIGHPFRVPDSEMDLP